MTSLLVVLVLEFLWRLRFWLLNFFQLCIVVVEPSGTGIIASLFEANVLSSRWSVLCEEPFEKGLLVGCYWKTLIINSLGCFCAFTVLSSSSSIFLFCPRYIPMFDYFLSSFLTSVLLEGTGFLVKIDSFKSRSCTYLLKWKLTYFATSSGRTHLNWLSWFKMLNLFEGCWFSILSGISLSLSYMGKLRVIFLHLLFFLLLRFSSLLELDEEELLLEEVEVELFLLFRFLLFIWRTILSTLFSLSFSGVFISCIWSLLFDSLSTSAIILLVLLD